MVFTLKVEHTSQFGNDTVETNMYRYCIGVDLLKETPAEIMYDKKQKIYFQSDSTKGYLYRLNYLDVTLQPCKRLQKAKDFNRRITYQYDWAEIKVLQTGEFCSIENVDELIKNWSELKRRLTDDYVGKAVENYIREIDQKFQTNNYLNRIVSCHQLFGLLFIGIPCKHHPDWEQQKVITLSEYESKEFIETVKYLETNDDKRKYRISGATKPESEIVLKKYTGGVYMSNNEIFPDSVNIEIEYIYGRVLNKWNFNLEKCQ